MVEEMKNLQALGIQGLCTGLCAGLPWLIRFWLHVIETGSGWLKGKKYSSNWHIGRIFG